MNKNLKIEHEKEIYEFIFTGETQAKNKCIECDLKEKVKECICDLEYPISFNGYFKKIKEIELSGTQEKISKVCDDVKDMLIEKNRKYGDSALNPIRIFAKSDTVEQLKVRIDDKLNRFKNMQKDDTEDVINDLIGYLILLKVAEGSEE